LDATGRPTNNVGGLGDCFGLGGTDEKDPDTNQFVGREYAGAPEGLCTFFLSIGEAF
jgi:translocation and assembly module TamA